MLYVLAYSVFAPESAARIDAFRAAHEPERARLVRPHITLVFGVSAQHQQAVSDLVDHVAAETRVMPVVFDQHAIRHDPFENKHKLFLLCGAGGDHVTTLHRQLYDGPHRAELSADHPFEPHLTVASYDALAKLEQADLSALGPLPIPATLTALDLVQLEAGCLRTLKSAPLNA
ncbi:2'-5' RNA ligase family protein [Pseudaestuariivita sp.]|uniref:2'-5' RNA ligase family protein n=1 Tax=Pseudaestuariivita sp. TaxID=2211669 RepID=UPI0040589BDD